MRLRRRNVMSRKAARQVLKHSHCVHPEQQQLRVCRILNANTHQTRGDIRYMLTGRAQRLIITRGKGYNTCMWTAMIAALLALSSSRPRTHRFTLFCNIYQTICTDSHSHTPCTHVSVRVRDERHRCEGNIAVRREHLQLLVSVAQLRSGLFIITVIVQTRAAIFRVLTRGTRELTAASGCRDRRQAEVRRANGAPQKGVRGSLHLPSFTFYAILDPLVSLSQCILGQICLRTASCQRRALTAGPSHFRAGVFQFLLTGPANTTVPSPSSLPKI